MDKKIKNKFKFDLGKLEYKYLPTKKVEILAKRDDGEFVITSLENLVKIKSRKVGKRNPDKKILLQVRNKLGEKFQVCHYKDNNFLSVFVNGGVHNSRFMITKSQLPFLKELVQYSTIVLYKDNKKELKKNGKEHT